VTPAPPGALPDDEVRLEVVERVGDLAVEEQHDAVLEDRVRLQPRDLGLDQLAAEVARALVLEDVSTRFVTSSRICSIVLGVTFVTPMNGAKWSLNR
jgi:hypothetical protein